MRTIKEILSKNNSATIRTLLVAQKKCFCTPLEESEQQYNPAGHKVFDLTYRRKKRVKVPTDRRDPVTGEIIYKSKQVERVRIAIPLQKVIVERAVGFLFGNEVEYKINQSTGASQISEQKNRLFAAVNKVFHQNKMRYFDKRLARAVFRGREAAELWYMPTTDSGAIDTGGKMRVKLLSPLLGDKLYPHFNNYDKMDGFAREYVEHDESGATTLHFDVYDDRFVYRYINNAGSWSENGNPRPHGFTKIPLVYYRQEQSEWEDVQPLIERIEDLLSNWGDTNDYFGTPKYFVRGKLLGFAEKGEQGSVFQGEKDANMNVLSWDSSPSSVSGELGNLFSLVFSCSHSADVSFERMKEVGNNTSGAAIRLMLIDPHMNAQTKTELFGEMFTRRCNIVANGICETGVVERGIPESVAKDTDFEPIFKPFMPKNEIEQLQLINAATGGAATSSRRRGIELNPLNDDPDRVEQEMQQEQQQALALAQASMGMGDTSNNAIEA